MFGENYMLGIVSVKPDEKGRIALPKFTEVEKEDILVLIQKEEYLEIWNRFALIHILDVLEDKMQYASTEVERKFLSKTFNQILVLIFDGYRKVSFHGAKHSIRINLEKRIVEQYGLSQGAIIEARGSYLRLWNPTKFQAYKDSLGEIDLGQFTSLETPKNLSKVKRMSQHTNQLEEEEQ